MKYVIALDDSDVIEDVWTSIRERIIEKTNGELDVEFSLGIDLSKSASYIQDALRRRPNDILIGVILDVVDEYVGDLRAGIDAVAPIRRLNFFQENFVRIGLYTSKYVDTRGWQATGADFLIERTGKVNVNSMADRVIDEVLIALRCPRKTGTF